MSTIRLKNLTKTFYQKEGEVSALKDVSLEINDGDIYGIIGMSGAGKSTLVRCLNYLEKPTSGQVYIDEVELGSLNEQQLRKERTEIAMIFQHFNLLEQKNVIDNICLPLLIAGVTKKEARMRAHQLLETVGLSEKSKAFPSKLSGGQKQRVAIARALASNPKILLCDEATSALDPQTTKAILSLLKEINKKLGITIVIITHQMEVVREICNRVAIMEAGEVKEEGFVEAIFDNPKSKAAKHLIFKDAGKEDHVLGDEKVKDLLKGGKIVRIVFTENSAFEPVISNVILKFNTPINILGADTKNVGGIAKGEMLIRLPEDAKLASEMSAYLLERGLKVEEVEADVY
ncbi:methionine ABC transporter ATP-binding protein [Ohessyouella blattaphilus]|uniref:ATP-binding cassette domain-containing protein n=1 Tax=Ohessyouella blattaphilus TaxID=2949333 RepID=A0ABT1ELB3_9FIRM|nr:ATP-binding cassette domain-containing protein [Ohessyouella blattaphilus]MCP1110057.1 ATP-binding cassette domain-containing protein [Ohessyouella blattaphilus]MCR8563451.1 ATP-binding cassette domain-containing protein [Ohessyouella blattaphilus]